MTANSPSFSDLHIGRVIIDPDLFMEFIRSKFLKILAEGFIYACDNLEVFDIKTLTIIRTDRLLRVTAEKEFSFIKEMLTTTFGVACRFPSDEVLHDAVDRLVKETLENYRPILDYAI